MSRKLVYDWPTRVFHWLFVILFLTTILIAKINDDDSPIFSYHMMAGLTLSFLVVLRIIWGFAGSKYARFSSFQLHPRELFKYLKGIISKDKKFWSGHNPASSYVALGMMFLALGLGASGYQMVSGNDSDWLGEVHEIFGNAFIVIVIAHILGIIIHSVRLKDFIGLSMLDGKKNHVPSEEVIHSAHGRIAIAMAALVLGFGVFLIRSYEPNTKVLSIFGNQLQLGELEEENDHDD